VTEQCLALRGRTILQLTHSCPQFPAHRAGESSCLYCTNRSDASLLFLALTSVFFLHKEDGMAASFRLHYICFHCKEVSCMHAGERQQGGWCQQGGVAQTKQRASV